MADVVGVVGRGVVVDETACEPGPVVPTSVLDDEDAPDAGDGPAPGLGEDGPGEPWGAVLVGTVVVGAVVVGAVLVVVPDPEVLVARTELGENVGCPSGPMSVDPNVHASTLPGGGR